ncbi:SRPBCC domain-containing protein, partial [Leptospira interrogans]
MKNTTNQTKDELLITRIFNAPRETIFDAWT